MKLCSPLEEEDELAGDRKQRFISSPDRLPYHVSRTSTALTRSTTPGQRQTSSQTPPNINVFPCLVQPSKETNHKDQQFTDQSENDQAERKYSPPLCLANRSPAIAFRTSPASEFHKLHPEDQPPGSDTTRAGAETSDKTNRAPIDLQDTPSAQALPVGRVCVIVSMAVFIVLTRTNRWMGNIPYGCLIYAFSTQKCYIYFLPILIISEYGYINDNWH